MTQIVETTHDGSILHFKVTGRTRRLHNPDGPAVIDPRGIFGGARKWYRHGKLHRDDGPAIMWGDGDWDYYQNGKRHRLDGPASLRQDGIQVWVTSRSGGKWSTPTFDIRWFINDKHLISESDYNKAVARWLSYREVTREDIKSKIGNFRIVEW